MTIADELNAYSQLGRERDQLAQKIDDLRKKSVGVASGITGAVPSVGGEHRPTEDSVEGIDKLVRRYERLSKRLMSRMYRIEGALSVLNPLERMIFRYKYLDGLPMAEIAQLVGYSERQCWRIHKEGLRKMS